MLFLVAFVPKTGTKLHIFFHFTKKKWQKNALYVVKHIKKLVYFKKK